MNFSANCRLRMLARVPEMTPKVALAMLESGALLTGWFMMLKASKRNCSLCYSVRLESFRIEESQAIMPGASRAFRPKLPWKPSAALRKAAGLK